MKNFIISALLLLALLLPVTANAYVELDGIYYDLWYSSDDIYYAEVVSGNNYYTGDVTIPEAITYNGTTYSVTAIGEYAFCECIGLTSVIIGNSVTDIGEYAFYGCIGLTSVIIGNSVRDIGAYAFCSCSDISSITIPESVTFIGIMAFGDCTSLNTLNYNAVSCNFLSTEYPQNQQWQSPFSTNIRTINIGDSVRVIPAYFAYRFTRLTSITIPESVSYIGERAFESCPSLDTLNFDAVSCNDFECHKQDDLTGISYTVIYQPFSDSMLTVNIGETVQRIPAYFAYRLTQLTGINIPSSVISIGKQAFSNCTALSSVSVDSGNPKYDSRDNCNAIIETASNTLIVGCKNSIIPSSITSIGMAAFSGCTGLTRVDIPNSVTSIGMAAFSDCRGLTSIDIPNSVDSVGSNSFNYCSGLTSITIPESVSYIGEGAFESCSSLDTLNFNAISCADFECLKQDVYYGDYYTVNYQPFFYLISNINIGNNVLRIPAHFASGLSQVTSVTIPGSVSSIGSRAFSGCSGITDVYSFINDLSSIMMGDQLFVKDIYASSYDNYDDRTLHVPRGTIEAYQTDNHWSLYFGSIVEMDYEAIFATSIELNQTSAEASIGETLQLMATVLPDSATNKRVNWTCSDVNVASVNTSGLVTAVAPGTAIITATTVDGSDLSASCVLNVVASSIPVDQNEFHIDYLEAFYGDTIVIPVQLSNEEDILAFQTDIYLPEGFSIVTDDDDEFMITPSSRLTNDHVIMADQLNDGSVRVICYTPRSRVINGNEGDLFYITVAVPVDAAGDYNIQLRNTLLTASDYSELIIPDISSLLHVNTYIPGDVNDSRTVNVTDIVFAAQYILQRNPSPFIFEAADMNGDGNITVTDIMLIARLIMTPTMNIPKRMPAITSSGDCMSGDNIALSAGETRRVSIALDNAMDYNAFQLDLMLPDGMTASNFQLTDRAGNHALDVDAIDGGKLRALCYSPTIEAITGHSGALLTFDVTASSDVKGDIVVDGIELVTTDCQTMLLDAFTIGVNNVTSVNELATGKTVVGVEYFNLAGQRIDCPDGGVTLVVTTYTDGTRIATKVIR